MFIECLPLPEDKKCQQQQTTTQCPERHTHNAKDMLEGHRSQLEELSVTEARMF